MRMYIILVLLVTWIYCDISTVRSSSTQLLELQENRVKRTIVGSLTANPSGLSVIRQTALTQLTSAFIRLSISLERRWLDLTSKTSAYEITSYIVLGIISTFAAIFAPLMYLMKGAVVLPLAFLKKKRSAHLDVTHLDFSLPDWMDQMESWVNTYKPSDNRYRCCFYPTEPRPGGLARCFPLLTKYMYPWNNPCSKENSFRDVVIDKDYKLH